MVHEGRRIVGLDIRKGRQKGSVVESDRKKRKLLTHNFQNAEIQLYKGPPASPLGEKCKEKVEKLQVNVP